MSRLIIMGIDTCINVTLLCVWCVGLCGVLSCAAQGKSRGWGTSRGRGYTTHHTTQHHTTTRITMLFIFVFIFILVLTLMVMLML